MGATALVTALTLSGVLGEPPNSLRFAPSWQRSAVAVQALKLIALSGATKSELFVQDKSGVAVVAGASGALRFERALPPFATTSLADVDGDDGLDLLVFERASKGVVIEATRLQDRHQLWRTVLPLEGELERGVAVRLDASGRAGAVLSSSTGELVAISPDGKERWRQRGAAGELVTLQTIRAGSGAQLTLSASKTELVVVDASGAARWQRASSVGVRRVRSLEPTGGDSFVLLGEENGTLTLLSGSDGRSLWSKRLGQPPTELGLAELDGNPSSSELVVGGKGGGLWAFSLSGQEVLSLSTEAGKISQIAQFLLGAATRDSLLVGGSDGKIVVVSPHGKPSEVFRASGPIERLSSGQLGERTVVFAAAGSQLAAHTLAVHAAPRFYSLLAAGTLGCIVIALVGLWVGRTKPPRPMHGAAEQLTIEAQKARKSRLRESLRELEQLGAQLAPAELVQRRRALREQLADADRRLLALGASLEPEMFRCPQCGGPLELGAEKCGSCGGAVVG